MHSGLVLQKEELLLILFMSSKASSEDMHVSNVQPKCLTGSFVSWVSMFIRGSRKRRKQSVSISAGVALSFRTLSSLFTVLCLEAAAGGKVNTLPTEWLSQYQSTWGQIASLKKRGTDSAGWCSRAKMGHIPAPTLNAELDLPCV